MPRRTTFYQCGARRQHLTRHRQFLDVVIVSEDVAARTWPGEDPIATLRAN